MTQQPEQPATDLPKMSAPAQRALAGAGITRLDQLTTKREAEIAKLHGMGPKALRELREALAAHGLKFAGSAGEK
ncbi:MAG TPA: DNA-directed RNA polymerase subunit alpha C-terminal domain-containing protein [Phototrophicaceae bacterium]|nr:DNA-directed RNA polymerase subunit alpha C-terminal domain-containing protein [Phototrophicaceae bacterium]